MTDDANPTRAKPMMAFNIEKARYNMVEQQIRTWEVLDERVLDLLFHVRREEFVPGEYRALAFADVDSIEIDRRLADEASAKLARQEFRNARVIEGDGARGYGRDTYDAIVLT